jgi:hypothetical protein
MNGTPEIVIYEGGEARVEVRVERENVWLSLQQPDATSRSYRAI